MPIPASLPMFAGEIRLYDVNFGPQAEIVAGETITSVSSVSVDQSGLTLTTDAAQANPIAIPGNPPTISGNKVYLWISGLVGNYVITVKAVTSGGAKVIEKVRLVVT